MSEQSGTTGKRELQAVFFDMDGTLVRSEHLWLEAEIAVCAELGGVWTAADQELTVGGPLPKLAAAILARVGRDDLSVEQVGAMVNADMERRLASSPVAWMPGAQRLLAQVRAAGVPCALVSASFRNLVDAVLDAVGRELFDTTVAGDEVQHAKPAPDAYVLAAHRLGVDADSAVVLEDSPTGVRAGEAAGCVVVAIPSVVPIAAEATRTVVASLEEVDLALLRTLVAGAPTRVSS